MGDPWKVNSGGFNSTTDWPARKIVPFIMPPGMIGIESFVRPAGTLNVRELEEDVDNVTVEGAVVITTAQTASSN